MKEVKPICFNTKFQTIINFTNKLIERERVEMLLALANLRVNN